MKGFPLLLATYHKSQLLIIDRLLSAHSEMQQAQTKTSTYTPQKLLVDYKELNIQNNTPFDLIDNIPKALKP